MKLYANPPRSRLARLVVRFMSAMHRCDDGRTLPLRHSEKLTTAQFAVLEFVRAPRTVSAIAVHVGLSRPATSQMIHKLVKRRLVRRSEGTLDRREKAVDLSASGITLLEKISRFRSARFRASLAALSPATCGRLGVALESVVAELEKTPEKIHTSAMADGKRS